MFGDVVEVREELRRLVASLDAEALEPALAETLVREFATIEHVAAAGKALAARRVAESGRWRRAGMPSEADWLACATGDTVGAARAVLDTAQRLDELEETGAAFRAGQLSPQQAAAIAGAAVAEPAAENSLLAMAQTAPLTKLRERCDRVRAAALPDRDERHARIHRAR